MISKLQQWKRDEDFFVETTACNHVLRCLLDNGCVSVVGPPGIGKTFLVRHVALEMENIGFNVISVKTPNEIKQNYQLSMKLLFVVDDMCGNFTANTARLDKWKKGMQDITGILDKDSCKLLLTCREQVFRDEGFKHSDMEIFQTCICNLLDEKIALTDSEKENIAKRYFSRNYTNDFKRLFKYDFFPLLCKLYFNKNFSIQSILKDPFHCYRKELNNLFLDCKEGKYKISALLFLTVCNNRVEKNFLAGRDKRVNYILEDICYECGINEVLTGKFLMKELDVLTGTFVSDDKEFYHTIHDKLFDFMAYYFGTKNEVTNTEFIGLLIKHADYKFVRERFVIKEHDTKKEVYLINIQDDNIPLYIERVFSQLTKSADIFEILKGHGVRMNKSFHNALSTFIHQLRKDEISSLIQNASSDFVCSMFVMNVNEIKAFCKVLWLMPYTTTTYGIILDHHIQKYIERMFDDMTKSDNVVDYMSRCRCCRSEEFRTELLIFISKLSSIKVTNLIQKASESFIMHMCVMKVEDIHQRSESIHERYGIVLNGDHIQLYSERFLNTLKYCMNVPYYINMYRCGMNNDFNTAIQSCMVSLSSGRIKELIESASNSFIQNMFVITVEDTNQISRQVHNHYGIKIPGDVIQFYIERVFHDLTRSTHVNAYLQQNRNSKNTIFQTRLLDYMRQLGEPKIKHLIKISSQDFIDRLCVMSIDDIGDFYVLEYNRYGVILSGDVIKVYIERVFDGITSSEDVDEHIRCNRNKRNTIFQNKLLEYMRHLGEPQIKHLIEIASQDFIDRLCVMSIDDIKDNCDFEYERYGVIIPKECISLYIARWLNGMTTLDDIDNYVERNRNRKTTIFKTSLHTFMDHLQEDEIKKLIQTGSADFLHKWFVSDDVKNNSIKDNEHGGIILKDKNLQEYNERILTLMKYNQKYYKHRIPRSVMKYLLISELQISKITEFINEANVNVFHKMIIVNIEKELRLEANYSDSQSAMQEELMRWPESLINQYMDRMLSDWGDGQIYRVINNINLENQSFEDKFLCHLKLLDPSKISKLLQTKCRNTNETKTAFVSCCMYGKLNLAIWCLENYLHDNPKTKKRQLRALLLLVVLNGRLEDNVLIDEFTKVNEVILSFSEMNEICESVPSSGVNEKEELDVLLDYICVRKEGANYVFIEEVLNFFVFYFASIRHMSQLFVDYADEILLIEQFLVDTPISNQHDFIVHVSDEQLQTCIGRVFKYLSRSEKKTRHVLYRSYKINVKSVTAYIRKLNEEETNSITENACIDFLNKMCIIVTGEIKDHIVEESELYFVIPDDTILIYIKRFFYHVAKSDCVEACLQDNRNKNNKIFRAKLSIYMNEINKDDIETLINQASSDFISRMFITSGVDIKDESCWEYERYGFFVPEEFLQIYIKRVFSDMAQSINVPVNRNSENRTFQDAFQFYTNSLSEDILASLIQTASSKFISRLYLSTERYITEISSRRYEWSLVFVPYKYSRIFQQKFKKETKSTSWDGPYTITVFKIKNDSNSFKISTYEDPDRDNVLIRIRRKHKKIIGNLQEHLIKYIDPLLTNKSIECYVRSTKSLVRKYIQRMIADWIKGNIYEVFGNINLGNLYFQYEFLTYLRNIDNLMQTKLANTNDNNTSDSPLAVSCYVGISQLAEWCLDKDIKTNSFNIYDEHLLQIAFSQNYPDIVCRLLNDKNKADIDTGVCCDILTKACKNGLSEIVLLLLKGEVNVNPCEGSKQNNYCTPLYTACAYGCEKIVSILLEFKAEEIEINMGVYLRRMIIQTPLYIACCEGYSKIVFLLLNHYADEVDVNMHTYDLETPLHAACKGGHKDIVSLLLAHKHTGINNRRLDGATSLFVSCLKGHDDVVSTLLTQKGIDIDQSTLTGMSPIFIATLLDHTQIVEMLLSRNADVNICIKNKDTVDQEFKIHRREYAFGIALSYKQSLYIGGFIKSVCKLICDNASGQVKSFIDGLEENLVGNLIFGSSILHISSLMGHIEIVKLLVDRTASINCFTENHSTPLFLACELGHENIVRVLLDKKANPLLERKDGKSPLSIATENGHLKIVDIIIQVLKVNINHSESTSKQTD